MREPKKEKGNWILLGNLVITVIMNMMNIND